MNERPVRFGVYFFYYRDGTYLLILRAPWGIRAVREFRYPADAKWFAKLVNAEYYSSFMRTGDVEKALRSALFWAGHRLKIEEPRLYRILERAGFFDF